MIEQKQQELLDVGSSGTPQGRFAYGGVVPDGAGGFCSNFTVLEGTPGTDSSANFRCWINGTGDDENGVKVDRFNYNPYNYVEVPSKRSNVFAKMTTDLDSGHTVGMMFTYQKRDSNQLLAPTPLFYGFQSYSVGEGIGAGNPYNPFGIDFCDLGWLLMMVELVMMQLLVQETMPLVGSEEECLKLVTEIM